MTSSYLIGRHTKTTTISINKERKGEIGLECLQKLLLVEKFYDDYHFLQVEYSKVTDLLF